MRPIRLEFNAFGPFAKNETVDFEQLQSGIFLVSGPTGAGKTTIFDGICFALYGEASGAMRQNENFKSDFADPADLCWVRYRFAVRDKQFEIYRAPKQLKAKRNGEMTFVPSKAELTLPDGTVISGPNPVSSRIQEIMGLNAKQFKQITMLAQGDFRRFLDATSGEKQEIFRHLFDTEKYDRFTLHLERLSKEAQSKISQEQQVLRFHLDSLTQREDEQLKTLLDTPFPLADQIALRVNAHLAEDDKTAKDLQEKAQSVEEKIAALQIESHKQHNLRILQLQEKQAQLQEFALQEEEIKKQEQQLFLVKKAQSVKPMYDKLQDSKKRADTEALLLKEKEEIFEKSKIAFETAKNRLNSVKKRMNEKEQMQESLSALQALQPLYAEYQRVENEWNVLKKQIAQNEKNNNYALSIVRYFRLRDDFQALGESIKGLDALLSKAQLRADLIEDYQAKKEAYLSAERLFFDAQAGLLAMKLQPDAPCPVCGSIHHPAPAAMTESAPSQEQLRQLRAELDAATQKYSEINSELEIMLRTLQEQQLLQGEKDEALQSAAAIKEGLLSRQLSVRHEINEQSEQIRQLKTEADPVGKIETGEQAQEHANLVRIRMDADQEVGARLKEQMALQKEKLPTQFTSICQLEDEMTRIKNQAAELDELMESAEKQMAEAEKAYLLDEQSVNHAKERAANQKDQLEKDSDNLDAAVRSGFGGDYPLFAALLTQVDDIDTVEQKLQQRQMTVSALKAQIDQLKELVADRPPSDIDRLLQQEAGWKEELAALREEGFAVANRMANDRQHLDQIDLIYSKIETAQEHFRQVNDLYKAASGANDKRIDFERYVLGFYFDAIVSYANRRLDVLTGGRYVLCRKKDREKFGRSSGLDLEILDQFSGKIRPTSTLSGGESFKTALALALSLADVVQMYAGGIVIETMFIDEGFGSLDSDSLGGAIQSLMSLSRDGRTVGIISHVAQLKEQIPQQIQVLAGRNGSTISMKV